MLLEDLRNIGVVDNTLKYLESYFQNRSYCVQIGNYFSAYEALTRGVPQGSVLGPILFCIYTISVSRILQQHGVGFELFADDTQFYFTITDIENTSAKINSVINSVKDWMHYKQLKLNDDKTEFMLVGNKESLSHFGDGNMTVSGNEVHIVESVCDLGVLLDSTLTLK